ncbi:MAG TPA: thioredoxin family protein [Gammaproteobacteria bacterium]
MTTCRALLLLLAVLLASPAAATGVPRDPYEHFFSQTFGDLTEELATARNEGKRGILLFFEMDECPFCHRMKQTVLNQPEVQEWFRQHFLSFSIDVEGDLEIVDFAGNPTTQKLFAAQANRVRATPVFAFFDLEGRAVARYTGATSGVEEFMLLGRYVVDEVYLQMPFTRYKREQRAQSN